jgi:hypothetical protein
MRQSFIKVCEKYLGKETDQIKVNFPGGGYVYLFFYEDKVTMIYAGGYMNFAIQEDTTPENMAGRLEYWLNM